MRQVVVERSRSMPVSSERLHPGGMFDNSPTFQRWVCEFRMLEVPKGRLKMPDPSAVPSGLDPILSLFPKVETLGYCRVSLREKLLARLLAPSFRSNRFHAPCP